MGIALAAMLVAAPLGVAKAAPADVALLQSYVGNYTGQGKMTDATGPETVRCRLSLQSAPGGKIIYTGRCSIAGGNFAMTGAMVFNGDHYEAAMSSSAGVLQTIIGQKLHGGVTFSSTQKDPTGGQDRTISSTMSLISGAIQVVFKVVDNKTGALSSGSIAFAKS